MRVYERRTEGADHADENRRTRYRTIALDADPRAFLHEVNGGQCPALASWAAKFLRAGRMTMADPERCLNLGFEF